MANKIFSNKSSLIIITCILFASCVNKINDTGDNVSSVSLEFQISPYETKPMFYASNDLSSAFTYITYLNYTEEAKESEIRQTSSDENFGVISDNLSIGIHHLYFVGHKQSPIAYNETNNAVSFPKVDDTFSIYTVLNVTEDTPSIQPIKLIRRVAKFELVATDAIPSNIAALEIIASRGSESMNFRTGVGTVVSTQAKAISIPSEYIGRKNVTFNCYTFIPENGKMMSFVISAKNKEGETVYSHKFPDAPMTVNMITRYTGVFFNDKTSISSSITVDSKWSGINDFEF